MNAQWRRRRRDVAANDDTSLGTVILALVAGALLSVTTGLAALAGLEQYGPAVGGIIVFRPDTTATERWSVNANIIASARFGLPEPGMEKRCILSPAVMSGRGGSLVIEARRLDRPPVYRVHWTGDHTGNGPGDCGRSADLILERTDLMRLANAAGGFTSGLRLIGP